MLYRFFDCGIYDNDIEPYTTLWIEAISANDAVARATAMLAAIWRVEPEQVCIQSMGRADWEIIADAIEDPDGGDRRLWAVGSAGTSSSGMIPLYGTQRVILAVDARTRARLVAAWRDAQKHAGELACLREGEALYLRDIGNVREAENREYDAKRYRDFMAAELF